MALFIIYIKLLASVKGCNMRVMVNEKEKNWKKILAGMGGVIRLFWGFLLI